MRNVLNGWLFVALASGVLPGYTVAAEEPKGNLASVQWLAKNRQAEDVLIIDASPAKAYAAKHIPGAINVDVFAFGAQDPSPRDMEARLQSWGVSPGKKIVVYDAGASYFATRAFFDLYYFGIPAADLFVLDGGLSKWQELGQPVTSEPTPPPKRGSSRIAALREDARVRLPEFLVASGDPKGNALVEALEPNYHFGESKFFDRAGHIPNAIMWPTADFYNADKTFKSAEEIGRMAKYLGITPEQQVHTHCGGGIAASVPYFALQFIAGYPRVKLYKESQLEWLRDDRALPMWTYDAPFLLRDMQWLQGWGSRMMRMFGVSNLSVLDVRPAESYKQGHVPYALNVPADTFREHLANPAKLAEILGPAGVDAAEEAVIISEGGLNPSAALAFLLLDSLSQTKLSILMGSVDDWGLRGFPLATEPAAAGTKKYAARLRPGVVVRDAVPTAGEYPRVFLASGKKVPAKAQDGKVIHVPFSELLNADGTPKAAKDLWSVMAKAGVPRYAEIICYADDPGEAAVNYFILKLMGYPDVKVLI
jgi:3-mercaptopyruvate sulfurtransferase SseA